jgi:phosphoribosylamine--glycine ligase
MDEEGMPYRGVLFAGLMITDDGPRVIEYNCRFGDPECQSLVMRLKSDLLEALLATAEGRLDTVTPIWHDNAALSVVMAAEGYPRSYEKGSEINGVAAAEATGAVVFHAGTKRDGPRLLANGGRVLSVTAAAPGIEAAQEKAYAAIAKIDWPQGFYRRDIGWRAINRKSSNTG